jgi:hypothetical protein
VNGYKNSGSKYAREENSNSEKKTLFVISLLVFGILGGVFWFIPADSEAVSALQSANTISTTDLRTFKKLDPAPRSKKPKSGLKRIGKDIFVAKQASEGISILGEFEIAEDFGQPFLALEMPENEFENMLAN